VGVTAAFKLEESASLLTKAPVPRKAPLLGPLDIAQGLETELGCPLLLLLTC
jgi:hypothetical protein